MSSILSSSSKKQYTTNEYDQRALADQGAIAISGDKNILQLTDAGAFGKAVDAYGNTIDFAQDAVVTAFDTSQALAQNAFDASSGQLNAALDYGQEALGFVGDAVSQSLDFGSEVQSGAYKAIGEAQTGAYNIAGDSLNTLGDFANAAINKTLSFAEDLVAKTGAQLAQTTATVTSASRSDTAATLDTFIKYGAGIMAAFFILQIFKKG